jgi:hypothetical protein
MLRPLRAENLPKYPGCKQDRLRPAQRHIRLAYLIVSPPASRKRKYWGEWHKESIKMDVWNIIPTSPSRKRRTK